MKKPPKDTTNVGPSDESNDEQMFVPEVLPIQSEDQDIEESYQTESIHGFKSLFEENENTTLDC